MKKPSIIAAGFLAVLFMLVMVCTNPQNPYKNPKSAVIVADSSLTSLKDSLKLHATVACTVSLYLPDLIDSIQVHIVNSGADTVIAGGAVTSNQFVFPFSAPATGTDTIKVIITRTDNSRDTLVKQIVVYVLQPVVTPDSLVYHVVLSSDSFTVRFTATDPDSNLRFGYTWLDTSMDGTQTTAFTALKAFHEKVSRVLHMPELQAGLSAPIVCHAYALDADSLFSIVSSCTVYVNDTTTPTITLVSPDTALAITALPVMIKAVVTDLDGINTVTFNGSAMAMSHDTAFFNAPSVDSGKSADSIVATDKAGNRTALHFSLTYQGKKLYPPKIIELSRATTEGHPFTPLFLDTCVTLSDTSIADVPGYKKDSLAWLVTDSAGNQLAVPASHIFAIPFPTDTEWAGSFKLTFTVSVKNTPTLFDTKQPSFFVTEVYDPPVITFPKDLCSRTGYSDTIYLDAPTTVRALDNKYSTLNWTFQAGKHFKVDSLYSRLLVKAAVTPILIPPPIFGGIFNRHVLIAPITVADSGYYGLDTLQFTVKSPQGGISSQPVYFDHSKFCLIIIKPVH